MMNIVNVLVGLGFVGTIALLASLISYTKETIGELQATINEQGRMIQLQKDIIDEASDGICEVICANAVYLDEGETLSDVIDKELNSVWTKMLIIYDSSTVEEYATNYMNHLREQKELMEEYNTIAEPKRQYSKVVSLDDYRR